MTRYKSRRGRCDGSSPAHALCQPEVAWQWTHLLVLGVMIYSPSKGCCDVLAAHLYLRRVQMLVHHNDPVTGD